MYIDLNCSGVRTKSSSVVMSPVRSRKFSLMYTETEDNHKIVKFSARPLIWRMLLSREQTEGKVGRRGERERMEGERGWETDGQRKNKRERKGEANKKARDRRRRKEGRKKERKKKRNKRTAG